MASRFFSFFFTTHYSPLTTHLFISLVFALAPIAANAGLIRDAELEQTLRAFSNPIFSVADIPPEDVRLFIVGDPTINAFVAGGLNIFIHTGLIRATQNPGMLVGVIAHETGHITGAHLSQLREKSTRATIGSVLVAVLGAAVVASGGGQAGAGIIMGSQNMAQRNLFTDIRLNEQSADQAAIKFLEELDISTTGMLEMFEVLRRQDMGGTKRDPYLSTHPLSTERIATMRNHIAESRIPADQVPDNFAMMHARMVAKLVAFTEPYDTTLKLYPLSDTSLPARYARTIAEFQRSRLAPALAGINELIKQNPADPFFYDTKGQILFENGKAAEAARAYAKANELLPKSPLILTDYAKALIATDSKTELARAILILEQSRELDDTYDATWRQLAIAYGKQGKLGASYASLAEEAALRGDYRTVFQHVARARGYANADNALSLQLDDLEVQAKAQLNKKKEEGSLF